MFSILTFLLFLIYIYFILRLGNSKNKNEQERLLNKQDRTELYNFQKENMKKGALYILIFLLLFLLLVLIKNTIK